LADDGVGVSIGVEEGVFELSVEVLWFFRGLLGVGGGGIGLGVISTTLIGFFFHLLFELVYI
jgi:hypothetical protein